jgi:phosphotransferase system enzyme I (PtsP)
VETEKRIDELQTRLRDEMPEAASLIFTAHRMMLMDPEFLSGMRTQIDSGVPPPVAIQAVGQLYSDMFEKSDHAYMREKAEDVADLIAQLMANLMGIPHRLCADCEGRIVITRELFPSHMLQLYTESVKGIVLGSGGVTGHVAILARALDIPLVICNDPRVFSIPNGTSLLLDGVSGCIHITPSESVVESVMAVARQQREVEACDRPLNPSTTTADGTAVRLLANINLLTEVKLACQIQAEGVGLYRSEFPFLIRNTFPSETEQMEIYGKLFDAMDGKLVTVRTLDVGGEKALSYYDGTPEENPELGLRSIRFAMEHMETFSQQLRAILRAAAEHERLRVMFPMISSLEEFRRARSVVESTLEELAAEELPHHAAPTIGMMIEVPSVVEMMPELVEEVEFFSIGTNDFVQYLLAVDRNNEKVASYYQPHHPAVLRSLARAIRVAAEAGRDVAVCGEMAHDPRFLRFFLGCGVRILSADPHSLHLLQDEIAEIDLSEARHHADHLLSLSRAEEIETAIAL